MSSLFGEGSPSANPSQNLFFRLLAACRRMLGAIFGSWQWTPPDWTRRLGALTIALWRRALANPRWAAAVAVLLAAAASGAVWYAHRPKPHVATFTAATPALTVWDDKGNAQIKPFIVNFSEAVAPLSDIEKKVASGVELAPAFAGSWFWTNDHQLVFTPKSDWPIDQPFKLSFRKKNFFAAGVRLDEYSSKFRTAPFSAKISDSQFYLDLKDPGLRKLVATVSFSHAVDPARFEQHVSLIAADDAAYLGLSTSGSTDSRHFTVVYDKLRLEAHVHSAPLAMPKDDTKITLRIDKGVESARGGNGTPDRLEAAVVIPGRSSLRFTDGHMTLVENARYEPEQVLVMQSSSPVMESAFNGQVSAWILPMRHPDQAADDKGPWQWSADQVGQPILAKSKQLPLAYLASDGGSATTHGFKFLAPPGRFVYIAMKEGIQGTGGFTSGKPTIFAFRVDPYPQTLRFLGQGSLLALSGDRKLGFMVRDVDKVEVEVGRVLPNQLQHIANRMNEFSKPYTGDIDDFTTERFTNIRNFSGHQPGKPVYDSIDLGQYLQDRTQNRRGLFLLQIRKPLNGEAPQQPDDDADRDGDDDAPDSPPPFRAQQAAQDSRLVLVTDIGFIVKQALDGSRDVYVQSIHTGEPIGNARVEVEGNNGLPVAAATTDGTGHAHLPKLEQLLREKNPLMVLVQKDADFSFMPLRTSNRGLDNSRFDTGGTVNARSAGEVSAYLFSDRGIYRPGETAHLGIITRASDWSISLNELPIVIEIADPRGMVVSRNPLRLSASAFSELTVPTEATAPTGTWQATAFLVKDERHREMLGTTSFRVQEFEPDRMKVRLDLSPTSGAAWLTAAQVKPQVTAAMLYGEPAVGRKVESEMTLTPVLPSFPRYPDHRFQIGQVIQEPFRETLPAITTDDKGNAVVNPDLSRFAGRAYRLNLLTRVFEPGSGHNVAAQSSAIVSDAKYLVGVKPDGDLSFVHRGAPRAAHWLAVDASLNPVAAENLKLEWVQRKYVSVLTEQPNHTYKYVSRLKEIVRETHPARIAPGGSNIPLPVNEPGDFVLILRDKDDAELNRLYYTVAGDGNLSRSLERDAELQIVLDKSAYAGGETMQVSIRAPYMGSGLITIERDRVYYHQWFHTTTTSTVQKVTLPRDFEGNGYVSVEFLRDPSSDEIFMSPLSWGVAPFAASLAARTQTVKLTTPQTIKPGATLNIRVAPAEQSRIAVLAVDEGILQVARYKNPDPLGYFFQKRMLQVETSQILDLVLPEFQKLMALAAPGGDADGGYSRHLNPFNRKHKPPVAWWSGVLDAGPEGKELHYTVPDYFNGRIRVVAIAVSPRRVGVSEAGVEVKGDFILTPNVPAMVTTGDEFAVSVGVFNNLPRRGDSTASLHVVAQVSRELSPVGATELDVPVAAGKDGVAEFRFRANPVLGAATLRFAVRQGRSEAHEEESVSVRPATPFRIQATLGKFDGARTNVNLARDMYPEKRAVEASVSALPLVWGTGLIRFLGDYPYLCSEQLVSKGFGVLIPATRPEFGALVSPQDRAGGVSNAFSAVASRQNESGGLGLWSSSPITADFPTVWAAEFLVEAKDRNQKIPADTLASLNAWLNRTAVTPAPTLADARLRAWAAYLLARQGVRPTAAVMNVEQELSHRYAQTWQTDISAAWLAATYRLMQRNDDAEKIIRNVPWAAQKKDVDDDIYYSHVDHDAALLYILSKHFPNRAANVPANVLEGMARDAGSNSLSAAWTLLALDAFAKASGGGKFGISATAANNATQALVLTAGAMPRAAVPEAISNAHVSGVQFTEEGVKQAYYSVSEAGFDRNFPPSNPQSGIEVYREFTDAKGAIITRVKVGDEFMARIRIRSRGGQIRQVAVVDLLPAGVEPILETPPPADSSAPGSDPAQAGVAQTRALPIGIPTAGGWTPQQIDLRDDRLILFGDISSSSQTFLYRVRATSEGVFQTPPVYAEGMYNRAAQGFGPAGHLEVVK